MKVIYIIFIKNIVYIYVYIYITINGEAECVI